MPENRFFTTIRHEIFIRRRKAKRNDKICTRLTKEEKMALHLLSLEKRGFLVAIGSYLGASSCFMALEQVHKNPLPKLYCVDTWTNDAMSEGARDTLDVFLNNTKDFKEIIRPLRGRSTAVTESFREKIDFLFIDGDHSYHGVKADIQAWFPKLNSGGLVVFHDFGWEEGVKKAVEEDVEPIARNDGRLPNLRWATI